MCNHTIMFIRQHESICRSSASTWCGLWDSDPRRSLSCRTCAVFRILRTSVAYGGSLKRSAVVFTACHPTLRGVVSFDVTAQHLFPSSVGYALSGHAGVALIHAAAETAELQSAWSSYTVETLNSTKERDRSVRCRYSGTSAAKLLLYVAWSASIDLWSLVRSVGFRR